MELVQAQQIINGYSKLLSKVDDKNIFMSKSMLPCSDAMIKYAFYTYVDELVRMHKMTLPAAESLIVAYGHLSFFVEQEYAEALNKIANKDYHDNRDEETIRLLEKNHAIIKELSLRKEIMVRELTEYIRDCIQVVRN
jgi:hypothetical protein